MILEAQEISKLIHNCDTDNLMGIAEHILGYEVFPEDVEDGGNSIIGECDFILENFMPKKHILKLHKQIFEN